MVKGRESTPPRFPNLHMCCGTPTHAKEIHATYFYMLGNTIKNALIVKMFEDHSQSHLDEKFIYHISYHIYYHLILYQNCHYSSYQIYTI